MTISFTCSGRYRFCLGILCWLASHMGVLGSPSTTPGNKISETAKSSERDEPARVSTNSPFVSLSGPRSVSAIDPAKCYRLVSRLSGKVIGIDANGQADGTPLRQRTDANLLAQGWRFTPEGNYYNITVLHTQKGLQVANSSVADDALVEQWTYWGGYHQQWLVERNGEGFYSIRNRNSTKALTVRDASVAEGALISQQPLGPGQHQQWRIEERACPASARIGAEKTDVAFSLWPNPARDHVLINLSAAGNQSVDMQLTDLLGRSLQQQLEVVPAEPYRVDTSHLPDGLYLIRLTPAGQLPATLRLLIQR